MWISLLSVCVCLCVCPLAYLENHTTELHQIFMHDDCGRGSLSPLLTALRYIVYTSGFVYNVMISL